MPTSIAPGPVNLLCPMSETASLQGRVTSVDGADLRVELDGSPAGLEVGHLVVLDGQGPDRGFGTVSEIDANSVHVHLKKAVERDKRDFPRTLGGIQVFYRRAEPGEAEAWLDGVLEKTGTGWREPDPFMSFSGSGLSCEDEPACAEGDLVLLQIGIPNDAETYRGTASVVRTIPLPEPGPTGATHTIALHFEELPPEAIRAMVERTRDVQRHLSRTY